MPFTPEQIAELDSKLHPKYVKQLDGNDYIESWVAIHRANSIFGFDGWGSETTRIEIADKAQYDSGRKWEVTCFATVRVTAGGVSHEGVGSGAGFSGRISAAVDSAIKEAESDALKRALRQFGNQFGNALYDKQKRFVGVQQPANQQEAAPIQSALEDSGLPDQVPDDAWPDLIPSLIQEVEKCSTQSELDGLTRKWGALARKTPVDDQKRLSEALRRKRASIAALEAA